MGSLDELVVDDETAGAASSSAGYDLPSDDALLEESLAAMSDLLVELSAVHEAHPRRRRRG